MPILKDCELYYAWLTPEYPNKRYNKENPTWEVQLRTTDKNKRKEWEAQNLVIKAIVPDDEPPFFRVNLKKRSLKKTDELLKDEEGKNIFDDKGNPKYVMEEADPPEVLDAQLNPLNPSIIGNGSIGDVKVYQYEYPGPGNTKRIGSVLMGIRVTKLIEYIRKPRSDDEEFEKSEEETVVVKAKPEEMPTPKMEEPDEY